MLNSSRCAGPGEIGVLEQMRGEPWSRVPPTTCADGGASTAPRSTAVRQRGRVATAGVPRNERWGNHVSTACRIRADPEPCQDAWEGGWGGGSA